MNERIRELAEQAKIRPALLLKHWGKIDALTDSEQKELEQLELFAELIVRECIQMADEFELEVNRSGLVDRMKCHFGVE